VSNLRGIIIVDVLNASNAKVEYAVIFDVTCPASTDNRVNIEEKTWVFPDFHYQNKNCSNSLNLQYRILKNFSTNVSLHWEKRNPRSSLKSLEVFWPLESLKKVNNLLNRSDEMPCLSSSYVSEIFSLLFCWKIEKIRATLRVHVHLCQLKWLPLPEFRHFYCVLDRDIVNVVKSSKRSSSPADTIPVRLLCSIIDCICPSITQAINSTITSGVAPAAFKYAIVSTILKKAGSDPEIFRNY